MRAMSLALLALVASLALLATPAAARPFPETGYSITNDKIQDYFDRRGGVRVFGYPISREFDFRGSRVQFFQRAVLQLQPDGSVGLLNLLSDDLLPYTRINGSTFPTADPAILQAAPAPSDSDYASRAIAFVKAMAPDTWEGLPTNFYTTFLSTVSYQEAFPDGGADPGLMDLINLEIWGLPTSKPAHDPNNSDFVYLRFQRGIMHFDRTTGLTQGILLGDYLKALITGQSIPADLEAQATGSRLYRQYNNGAPFGILRPADLPATNLFAAFEKDGVVPVPVPVATVAPTTGPAAPTAAPAPQAPPEIQLVGPAQFTNVMVDALKLLAAKSPHNYALVKQYVYKIALVDGTVSSNDLPGRTLNFSEEGYLVEEWYGHQDQQTQWVAGVIVHNAVHLAQYVRGAPTTGADAEMEAMVRQQDVLNAVDTTTNPARQFVDFLQKAIADNTGWFTDYYSPPGPKNPF